MTPPPMKEYSSVLYYTILCDIGLSCGMTNISFKYTHEWRQQGQVNAIMFISIIEYNDYQWIDIGVQVV